VKAAEKPTQKEQEMATVLVTGANGFIGSHLIRQLLQRGHVVRGLVRKTSDLASLSGLPISLYIGDVRDASSLAAPLQGVEYVYHLGAALLVTSLEEFLQTNTLGTQNMLEAAEKYAAGTLKRFLYVSSQAAAGPASDMTPIDETAERRPVSWYGLSKMKAEDVVLSFSERLPVTIVRPSSVYGERERDVSQTFGIINAHIQPKLGILSKHTVMVYVEDLARGFIAAAESPNSICQVYFLNHADVLSTLQVTQTIAAALGKPAGIVLPTPLPLLSLAAPLAEVIYQFNRERPPTTRDKVRELSQRRWLADPAKARRDFGWVANTGLLQGMQSTTQDYFKTQRELVEMAQETNTSRTLKYLTVATLLGALIEISSATGHFYSFTPGWFVFVIIFACFGLGLGLLALLLRRQGGLVQLLAGTVLAGAVELANALHLIPGVRWDFAPGWPFGIDSPIWRSLVLGLAGGIFIIVVNAILVGLYQRRLQKG
jgi:dihydroflavonol-4-reductase